MSTVIPATWRDCPECAQGKHTNCTITVLDTDDKWQQCPCLKREHLTVAEYVTKNSELRARVPALPYAGTSGHSGTDTSRERAERQDSDGTTAARQRETLSVAFFKGSVGMTVKDLRTLTGWHHGQASSVLSVLHKEGLLHRLVETRDRCHVYVHPDFTGARETQPHGRTKPVVAVIDADHIDHQREWSEATFGPGPRTKGVVDHITKELREVEADPLDLDEWVDIIILGFDGAWRAGHGSQRIIDRIKAKQEKNEGRTWPDWRTADVDRAIEHDRTGEAK